MRFARVLRPIFNQSRRAIGEMSEVKPPLKTITTREEFARHWPEIYAKQEHHISQLKKGIPVHYSGGPGEVMFNYTLYGVGLGFLFYQLYLFYELAQK